MSAFPPHAAAVCLSAAFLLLSGCGSPPRVKEPTEGFASTTTHTRSFAATQARTCEAARRALLSQGYLLSASTAELVSGRKSFQPTHELHVEVEMRVVCTRDGEDPQAPSMAFATALQDRYTLKKVNNSASLGVGGIGSLSLPFSASDDALVKVGSETVTDEDFYERFFNLLERYLAPARLEPAPPVIGSPRQPPAAGATKPATTRATTPAIPPAVTPAAAPAQAQAGSAAPSQPDGAGVQPIAVAPQPLLEPVPMAPQPPLEPQEATPQAPLVPVPPTASRG